MSRPSLLSLAAALSLLALGAAAPLSSGAGPSAPCTAAMLSGTFKLIPGSAGAGNIVYQLRLVDTSTRACFVTGVPAVMLLDAHGKKLPTTQSFSGRPGMLTAVMVPLTHGKAAKLTARFSPDIPSGGEPNRGACEPTSYKLRVTLSAGGSLVAPITPPTTVCGHGSLALSVLTRA